MEQNPNCPSVSQRRDQTTIFMEDIGEDKSFKFRPSTTFCNLAFKFIFTVNLIDKKLVMDPNCPSVSQRRDQKRRFFGKHLGGQGLQIGSFGEKYKWHKVFDINDWISTLSDIYILGWLNDPCIEFELMQWYKRVR